MPSETPVIRTDIPGSVHYMRKPSQQPQSLTVHHDARRKLTVGGDITLTGEIASCDHLVVEGTVEAELHGGRRLDISPTGLFRGTVEIQEMDIAGTFEGNLIVFGKLVVRGTGRVVGNIQYGELEVHCGGIMDGSIAPLPTEVIRQFKPQQPVAKKTSAPVVNTEEKVERDDGTVEESGELFDAETDDLGPEYKKAVGQ